MNTVDKDVLRQVESDLAAEISLQKLQEEATAAIPRRDGTLLWHFARCLVFIYRWLAATNDPSDPASLERFVLLFLVVLLDVFIAGLVALGASAIPNSDTYQWHIFWRVFFWFLVVVGAIFAIRAAAPTITKFVDGEPPKPMHVGEKFDGLSSHEEVNEAEKMLLGDDDDEREA